jgi:hypothetical protein
MAYEMKFVVHEGSLATEIYLFPNFVTHSDFVNRMGFDTADVVSAGFVSSDLKCYGDSVSLKLKSRPEVDTALLRRTLRLSELD